MTDITITGIFSKVQKLKGLALLSDYRQAFNRVIRVKQEGVKNAR